MSQATFFQRVVLISGIAVLLYSLGLYFLLPSATQLWIWPAGAPLGLAFVAAWFAGGAMPLVWSGISGQVVALRALMLTILVTYTGTALHLFARHAFPSNERYLTFAALFALGSVLAGTVLVLISRCSVAGDRAIPRIIRWTFLLFSAILLPVGMAMVLGVPHVFPLPLTADVAAVYGWFFLGSFIYYFYGFLKPSLLNSTTPRV